MFNIICADRPWSTRRFSPAFVRSAELLFWMDPSDTLTLYENSTGNLIPASENFTVGKIFDKSGRDNHILIPTTSQRPVLRNDSGIYTLELDGVDDGFGVAISDLSLPHTIVALIRQLAWTSGGSIIGTPGSSLWFSLRQSTTFLSPNLRMSTGGGTGPHTDDNGDTEAAIQLGEYFVATLRFIGAGSSTLQINRLPVRFGVNAGVIVGDGIYFGRGATPAHFQVGNAACFSGTVSDAELAKLIPYMAQGAVTV